MCQKTVREADVRTMVVTADGAVCDDCHTEIIKAWRAGQKARDDGKPRNAHGERGPGKSRKALSYEAGWASRDSELKKGRETVAEKWKEAMGAARFCLTQSVAGGFAIPGARGDAQRLTRAALEADSKAKRKPKGKAA